ncbi:MAG: hypothetical protein LBT14_04475 [Treponema sp.]|jgi:hypothetical protein|nr:hypothetical protein [Treponema sp.]
MIKQFSLGVSLLVLVVLFFSCPTEVKEDTVITIQAISLNRPATGQMPVTQIQPTEQYTGTVSWQDGAGHTPNQFSADTGYTAIITLTPQSGYTLDGVAANFFTVNGATKTTNSAQSGVVTAVFPATGETGFYVINFRTDRYDSINAKLLVEGANCMIYAELDSSGNPTVTELVAQGIADEYDNYIHTQITGAFGQVTHMTAQEKVTLLLVDVQDFYAERGTYTAGFFDPTDMYDKSMYPMSNERDMLYIDTNPGFNNMSAAYDTVAHELQHLINFSNINVVNGGKELDLWINEGLSTAAEYIYNRSDDPYTYVNFFNRDPYHTIAMGNNFFVWHGVWENGIFENNTGEPVYDTISNYATAYLFFQWLRIHADNDQLIYKDIISAGAAGTTDYRSVTGTVQSHIAGMGLTFDTDWEKLIRTWLLANAVQSSTGVTGYKGKIGEISKGKIPKLIITYLADKADSKWNYFFPGEGVYSGPMTTGSYTPPSGSGSHIRYVGVNPTSGSIDDNAAGGYTGSLLLTFNGNSNNTIADSAGYVYGYSYEAGYLAGSGTPAAKIGSMRALSRTAATETAPYTPPAAQKMDTDFIQKRLNGARNSQTIVLPPDWNPHGFVEFLGQ